MNTQARWFALVSLILGALAGAYASSCMSRPRLSVQLLTPRIGTVSFDALTDTRTTAIIPGRLPELTETITWVDRMPAKATLGEYLSSLVVTQLQLQRVQKGMAELRDDLRTWPRPPYDGRALDQIYQIVWENYDIVIGHLMGETRLGAAIFASPASRTLPQPRYTITTDDDGDYHLSSGQRNIPIVWSTIPPIGSSRLALEAVARRCAETLAYGDGNGLSDLKSAIDKCVAEEAVINEALGLIAKEVARHSYWMVPVLVGNGGKDPVSLSATGMLYVRTTGAVAPDSMGKVRAATTDATVELERVEDVRRKPDELGLRERALAKDLARSIGMEERAGSPVLVPGGGAAILTYRSVTEIGDMRDGDAMVQWFKGGQLRCKAAVGVLTGHPGQWRRQEYVMSRERLFREVSVGETFPRRAW